MIRKILAHLASLPPRTNLYANLHIIMPPHNMVIAVMFSRERGGEKLSCGSIIEACVWVRLHTRASPCPRCTMLRTQWTSDRTGNVVWGDAVSQWPSVAGCRYTGYACSMFNRIRPPPPTCQGSSCLFTRISAAADLVGWPRLQGFCLPKHEGPFLLACFPVCALQCY